MEHSTHERGAIRKDPGGRLGVALVYPNAERLGMANLGFHAVYRLFNDEDDAAASGSSCRRTAARRARWSRAAARDFDVVAFSLSFEDDFVHLLELLRRAGLPLRAADRDQRHPLVVAGGIAMQINPEPVAPFLDAVLIGEGEELVPPFLAPAPGQAPGGRAAPLRELARLPGAYVPGLYEVEYADTRARAAG